MPEHARGGAARAACPATPRSACDGSIVIAHRSFGELDLLLRAHAVAGERARHPVLLGDLADDRPPAGPRGGQPERRGDRRLADAALAGHVEHRAIAQQRVHRSHPSDRCTSWTRRLREGYETSRRMLRRHDPTYYFATRRLPGRAASRHARALRLRPHGRPDRRRPAPRRRRPTERRAALDAWEAELRAGAASRQPIVRALADAAARHRLPLGELRTYMRSMRIDCGAGPDRQLGGARRPTWTARPARSGGSWPRCSASRPATTPTSAGSASRSSSRTSSATCARTGGWTASTCPREDRERFGVSEDDLLAPTPDARGPRAARATRSSAPARLFAAARPAIASAPASVRPGVRFATGLYGRMLDRVEAIGFDVLGRRAGVRVWHMPGRRARGAAVRARDAARRRAHAARRARRTC